MKDFLKNTTREYQELVAIAVGSTVAYFYQLAGGHRFPSAELAYDLERVTEGKLTRKSIANQKWFQEIN